MIAHQTIDPVVIDPVRPVLIAGPTASGKSALALRIAEEHGGVVVNADAIQVYDNWRILTARPTQEEMLRVPHALYGHVPGDQLYSVGHWLRDLDPLLHGPDRLIIVGGTGLYFTALTEGLADIPPTPTAVRAEADALLRDEGPARLLSDIDTDTCARIDTANPMRVQRAWEVQRSTGRGIAAWHAATPPPRLPLANCQTFLVDAPKDWLNARIAHRFSQMIANGALDEARQNLSHWSPTLPSSKAIGAAELIAYLTGKLTLDQASQRATIATRQFAKRQRTWFRARMGDWQALHPQDIAS